MDRRSFLHQSGTAAAGLILTNNALQGAPLQKTRVALVGTGSRGLGMWGRPVIKEFSDKIEFVGLCDINPGRVETGRKFLGLNCPVFTDFDQMMKTTKPDKLLVMSVDGVHHEHIVKGLQYGADVITEKPMTIDEKKCQAIIDAEKKTGKKVTVTFNYRY